jgi:hypothetical protein
VNGLCYDGGTNELDNTDGLESDPEEPEIPVWVGDCTEVPPLVALLQQMWRDHPTFKDPRGVEFLTSDMARCVELAGSLFRTADHPWAHRDRGPCSCRRTRTIASTGGGEF